MCIWVKIVPEQYLEILLSDTKKRTSKIVKRKYYIGKIQ